MTTDIFCSSFIYVPLSSFMSRFKKFEVSPITLIVIPTFNLDFPLRMSMNRREGCFTLNVDESILHKRDQQMKCTMWIQNGTGGGFL